MRPVTTRSSAVGPASPTPVLHLSFELGERQWKLAFTIGLGQRPRHRTIRAGDLTRLEHEVAVARQRFGLPATARVVSCYEAGRDGFWLHRALLARGIENVIVDASSIEVNRRARRAKSDRLDNEKLNEMLVRYHAGERRVWHVVPVPSEADEDQRHLERERQTLIQERTRLRNRLQGLLATHGVTVALTGDVHTALGAVRRWDGTPLPAGLLARARRDWDRLERVAAAITGLETERATRLAGPTPTAACARHLHQLRAIGPTIAWTFASEVFGWRHFQNRRQVGSLVGLTPTGALSGAERRELGIAKSGNPQLRALAVELAWLWVRYQPQSALSRWYQARYARGGPRLRRIGIVAVARKLVIALWRYVAFDQVPEGALVRASA